MRTRAMTRSTILFACFLLILASGSIAARRPRVFKVCNRTTVPCGRGGRVRSIARAVKRAKPGDWILVWPGVYHEKATPDAGVMITKPGIHLRGMVARAASSPAPSACSRPKGT